MVPCAYWIQTHGAGVYDYTSHKNSTPVTPHVIAHSLSRTYRFRGHSRNRWTVAEHSLLVREIGEQLCTSDVDRVTSSPYLLLHDAHEAFLGDMPAPLKRYLKEKKSVDLQFLELETDRRIYADLLLPLPPPWVASLIREADLYALCMEREAFMASKHEWVIDNTKIPSTINVSIKKELSIQTLTRVFRIAIEDAINAAQPA